MTSRAHFDLAPSVAAEEARAFLRALPPWTDIEYFIRKAMSFMATHRLCRDPVQQLNAALAAVWIEVPDAHRRRFEAALEHFKAVNVWTEAGSENVTEDLRARMAAARKELDAAGGPLFLRTLWSQESNR